MNMRQSDENRMSRPCGDFEPLLVLLASGEELDAASHGNLAAHLAACAACSTELDHERELLALLAEHTNEPDAGLLAGCRANLEDALDREEEGSWWRRFAGSVLPASWLSPPPAWSAALLVLIGFSVGLFGPRLLRHPASSPSSPVAISNSADANANGADANANASASSGPISSAPTSSALSALDLHTADVAGINVFPSASDEPPQVQLQMRTQQPITVQGTVDDNNVKNVLCYILQNNERFGPDVRLNAADLLGARHNDPEVQSVLCHAVRTDRSAAVRLKALEALNGADPGDIMRQTLLDALVEDPNPGVRVEAINELRGMAAKGQLASDDDHLLSVLRNRMQTDSSAYIRLRSAAAIRDLSSR
jgi:hypothetical protein